MFFRIRFAKYGVIKFIGHLDIMRYFQKAVRRSGLLIEYSQGYSPHQLMVFASPLGVGITSDGEYMDISVENDAAEITEAVKAVKGDYSAEIIKSMTDEELALAGNQAAQAIAKTISGSLTEGTEIISIRYIPWREGEKHPENAMSLVNGADYLMSVKDGYFVEGIANEEEAAEKWQKFISQDSINIVKKTKNGEKEMDIKPYIFASAVNDADIKELTDEYGLLHADSYESGIKIFLRLSAGSQTNIKPEAVMEAFCAFCGIEFNGFAWQIHRAQMYSNVLEKTPL